MKKYFLLATDQLRNNVIILAVICIEFVIMISCFVLCFGELELYLLKDKMYKESNLTDFYYVAVTTDEEENQKIDNLVDQIGMPVMTFQNISGMNNFTSIDFYSKSVFDNINIHLSKGEMIDFDKDYGDYVPCLISSEWASEYKPGQRYSFITDDDYEIGKFYVCGVVKNDLFFSETYSGFEYDPYKIIAYDPENLIDKSVDSTMFKMINTEDYSKFEVEYASYIENNYFQPYDYFYQNHLRMEKEKILPFVVLLITFFALAVTGLLSYSIVSGKIFKRQNGIYYLCGAKTYNILAVTAIKNCMIVAMPSIIAIPVIWYIKKNTEIGNLTFITSRGYLVSILICLCALAISSGIALMQIDRRKIIQSVKEF